MALERKLKKDAAVAAPEEENPCEVSGLESSCPPPQSPAEGIFPAKEEEERRAARGEAGGLPARPAAGLVQVRPPI